MVWQGQGRRHVALAGALGHTTRWWWAGGTGATYQAAGGCTARQVATAMAWRCGTAGQGRPRGRRLWHGLRRQGQAAVARFGDVGDAGTVT